MKKYKIISENTIYKDQWLKIMSSKVRLPNGKIVTWTAPVTGGAVSAVVLDKERNIYLVKEWRVAWKKELISLPIGGLGGKTTEREIIRQLHNELREELGIDGRKVEKLISYPSAHRTRTMYHVYLVQDIYRHKKTREEFEILNTVKMPFLDAFKLFFKQKVETTSDTLLGILLAKEKLGI